MPNKYILLLLLLFSVDAYADDGYRLWLKYDRIQDAARRNEYRRFTGFIEMAYPESPIEQSARAELMMGLEGLLGVKIGAAKQKTGGIRLRIDDKLPDEGFRIEQKNGDLFVSSGGEKGILYGAFALLRLMQTEQPLSVLPFSDAPKIQLRMLNHWDNPLGTIERGYAGASLWKWYELPEVIDPRYRDYARVNASIGINAVVINNVNASTRFLTPEYLRKVKALTKVFQPYGIQVFLSINFASPKILGDLNTSDPLDPQVRRWWQEKTDWVYRYVPDLGGFLVKANSEGEPGPQEYGRTHADGANMLAEALRTHAGRVIWRAFVYSPDPAGDRFQEAYREFQPLDGLFAPNVTIQVKNGPIDFQPREPFHPLFGAMPKTPLALEFQITQEYLGFSTNLVYQASLYKECLDADTYANGKGSTVARVIDGKVHGYTHTAIAGVANTGSDRNWTGHLMSQANWYAFGRLAWNHTLSEAAIADEWIKMTWTKQPQAVEIIKDILLKSRQIYVDFTTPLGLHHIMGQGIHFGPEPWLDKSARPDWTATYYHRADSVGLGFDRTASGNNVLALYRPEVRASWENRASCDLNYLLWFHHVGWNERLSTGKTLWVELCTRYYRGVEGVAWMQTQWARVQPWVDKEMFADVSGRLAVQHREALNWRDACVLYFQTFSRQPVPEDFIAPQRTLEEMKKLVAWYQLK